MSSIKLLPSDSAPGANSYSVIVNKCEFLDDPAFLRGLWTTFKGSSAIK